MFISFALGFKLCYKISGHMIHKYICCLYVVVTSHLVSDKVLYPLHINVILNCYRTVHLTSW